MKVEVTVELDVNILNASMEDVKKLMREMLNPKEYDALEDVRIKDIKIGL